MVTSCSMFLWGLCAYLLHIPFTVGECDTYLISEILERQRENQLPPPEFVLRKYFKDNLLTDLCLTKSVRDTWNLESSYLKFEVGETYHYERGFQLKNKTFAYRIEGNIKPEGNYLRYISSGEVPNVYTEESNTGKIYIIKIDPAPKYSKNGGKIGPQSRKLLSVLGGPPAEEWTSTFEDECGGSVITYYTCFDKPESEISDMVYVLRTRPKTVALGVSKNTCDEEIIEYGLIL